jgi:hypothetical protein
MTTITAAPPQERCKHEIWPATSCSACHRELEQALPTRPALRPYHVLEAFHRTWCRAEDCGRWVEKGEQIGFVRGVGVCCADCCGIGGAS